jgi:hypothetical protein
MCRRYKDLEDMELIDAVVDESQTELSKKTGRCNAGWAMLARLNDLRKRIRELEGRWIDEQIEKS